MHELRRSEIARAARTLAAAFHDDPFFEFVIPDPVRRRRWTPALMEASLRMFQPYGDCHATSEGMEGVMAALAPGCHPPPRWRRLLVNLRSARPMIAGGGVQGVMREGREMLRDIQASHMSEPHWYVASLGIEPTQQGKGLGGRLIRLLQDRSDRDGRPIYLETAREGNLAWYARFGFEVQEEYRYPGSVPTFWTLLRRSGG